MKAYFARKTTFVVAATLFAVVAGAAQAQSLKVQITGTSSDWYNSYASPVHKPKPVIKPKPKPPSAKVENDRPVLGVKRPYHWGYYGKIKPRRHVYTRPRPRRNVRGYANAPWNR